MTNRAQIVLEQEARLTGKTITFIYKVLVRS